MKVMTLPQYDNGYKVLFTITVDRIRADLTGATVLLKLQHTDTGRKIFRECLITDASMGECEYVFTSEDLKDIGEITSELQTNFSDGKEFSMYDPILIRVTEEKITDDGRLNKVYSRSSYSSQPNSVLNNFFN